MTYRIPRVGFCEPCHRTTMSTWNVSVLFKPIPPKPTVVNRHPHTLASRGRRRGLHCESHPSPILLGLYPFYTAEQFPLMYRKGTIKSSVFGTSRRACWH